LYWIHDGLQRLPCRSDNWATDRYQRPNAFRPLLLDAAMDAQRIYGTHEVNFLTRPLVRIKTAERSRRDAEGSNRSCQKVIKLRQWPCLNLAPTDMAQWSLQVRYRGQSRSRGARPGLPFLTRNGHWVAAARADWPPFLTRRPVAKC